MKQIILNIIVLFVTISSLAQQIPVNNQFMVNTSSFIPAASGFSGNIEAFMTLRKSWIGINGAPQDAFVNLNGDIGNNMAAGFTFNTDKTGNFTQTYLLPTFSYHIHFNENTSLSVGISPMYYSNQLNIATIQSFGTQIDPLVQNISRISSKSFDIGVSFLFNIKNFNFGVSVPQTIAMSSKLDNLGHNFALKRHYFAYASYIFEMGDWQLKPMAVGRATETSPINYCGALEVKFKKRIWATLGYSADNSAMFSIGAISGNNIMISYTYEYGIAGISGASLGSHEITFGFLIKSSKNFKQNATVFLPQQSIETGTNEDIANQIADLQTKIKKEEKNRITEIAKLQKQIDSLKNISPAKHNNVTTSETWLMRVVTQNINFSLLDNKILESSYSELDKYTAKLIGDSDLKVKILVYTDNLFSDEISKTMSAERAKAIADYFISKGVKSTQIIYEGMGAVDPVADNTTTEGREENNRVEFLFNKRIF